MDKTLFGARFWQAATRARDFAGTLVEERLPEDLRFRVQLNSSYDGHPLHQDEVVFPGEGGPAHSAQLVRCTGEQVIELLWRDGRVPEWINLSVSAMFESTTVIELLACGRFTANNQLLYHEQEGYPPFHVLGPTLPVWLDSGQPSWDKFSIFERSEAADLDELRYIARKAQAKAWSLDLHGPAFDDEALTALPAFDRLEILELHGSRLHGAGLAGLGRLPLLRILRIHRVSEEPFSLRWLSPIRSLDEITVSGLFGQDWGQATLPAKVERLTRLRLDHGNALTLHDAWPPRLQLLSLRAREIRGGPLPQRLEDLYLHVDQMDASELERLLDGVEAASGIDLSGTPVPDRIVEQLVDRLRPSFLNVRDCGVSSACLSRIASTRPKMRLIPSA